MIDSVKWSTGAAVGGDAVATATGYSPAIHGEVLAVYVAYQDSPPAGTTDFTLSDESDPASEAIISLTNAATNIKIYPRRVLETNDGTDLLYAAAGENVYGCYAVHGRLEATIAQADAGDSCDVTVWWRK